MQPASMSRHSKQPCSPSKYTNCKSTLASTSMTAGAANVRWTPRMRAPLTAASLTALGFIAIDLDRRRARELHELRQEQVGEFLDDRSRDGAERLDVRREID